MSRRPDISAIKRESNARLVPCNCEECNGELVPAYTARNHLRRRREVVETDSEDEDGPPIPHRLLSPSPSRSRRQLLCTEKIPAPGSSLENTAAPSNIAHTSSAAHCTTGSASELDLAAARLAVNMASPAPPAEGSQDSGAPDERPANPFSAFPLPAGADPSGEASRHGSPAMHTPSPALSYLDLPDPADVPHIIPHAPSESLEDNHPQFPSYPSPRLGTSGSHVHSPASPSIDELEAGVSEPDELGGQSELSDGDDQNLTPTPGVPQPRLRTVDEPFERPPDIQDTLRQASEVPFWRAILFLAAYIHLKYGFPHSGVTILLGALCIIFGLLGVVDTEADTPYTLKTAFRRLNLYDDFVVAPMCPQCYRLYDPGTTPDACCIVCDVPLYKAGTFPRITPSSPQIEWNARMTPKRTPKPVLQTPLRLPSQLIAQLINSTPQMEAELDKWRKLPAFDGKTSRGIQDGEVWRTIKGADGRPFFDNSSERESCGELRIGVSLGFDGFGFPRSSYSEKHSTGCLSLCVQNLNTHLKYRAENVLLCGLTPGPHELDADGLQHFMKVFVDDLLHLYDHGITVKTPAFPQGRLVRLVLVVVCCDHPAMCRMSGFGDHSTKSFCCTRCKISLADLKTAKGVTVDAFLPRDGKEHRELAEEYRNLGTKAERDDFCKTHGVRWSELNRLPYWDPVRMTIVDPMHNILLGITKNIWYDVWVRQGALRERTVPKGVPRELDMIHDYLRTFEMPTWVARLPKKVGYPAGGSLTSDEWKALLLAYGPIVIPMVWGEWSEAANADYQQKLTNWDAKERARQTRATNGQETADPEPKPKLRMHEQDDDTFLTLSAAMKLLLARSVRLADLQRAQELLQDFLDAFYKCHRVDIKPNHHYVTHIFDQIRDYGPVYSFWTYIFERMNKLLKNYSGNNHAGGEIEVTFMREFSREVRLQSMIERLALADPDSPDFHPGDEIVAATARFLLEHNHEHRGTIADLAHQSTTLAQDMSTQFAMGPGKLQHLSLMQQRELVEVYKRTFPDISLILSGADNRTGAAFHLNSSARFHDYLVINGRRITPSAFNGRAPNSIVQVNLGQQRYAGEVAVIISHTQPVTSSQPPLRQHLLGVRWFKGDTSFDTSPWDPYPELEVSFWEHDTYLDPMQEGPPFFISPELILSQASRLTLHVPIPHDVDEGLEAEYENMLQRRLIWATCGLTKDAPVL